MGHKTRSFDSKSHSMPNKFLFFNVELFHTIVTIKSLHHNWFNFPKMEIFVGKFLSLWFSWKSLIELFKCYWLLKLTLANITMTLISSGNTDKIKMAFLLFTGHGWSLYKSIYVESVSLNTNPNCPSPFDLPVNIPRKNICPSIGGSSRTQTMLC